MAKESAPTIAKLATIILAIVLAGTPLIAYMWGTVNGLLSGHVESQRMLISVPVLFLLIVLLKLTARFVARLETEDERPSSSGHQAKHGS